MSVAEVAIVGGNIFYNPFAADNIARSRTFWLLTEETV